ncbi:MAG: DUF2149 domain-containing protein [Methanosphaera stadtmanae]|nr:DUF2149 domain-containing protein [Methanosphaera stadtmanae]
MSLKRSRIRENGDDLDPMSSVTNMTDIMLVLAVGFLIFAVMSTGLEEMILEENSEQQMNTPKTVEIEQGKEVTDSMENIDSDSSGYTQSGIVYKDPKTNKEYIVTTT